MAFKFLETVILCQTPKTEVSKFKTSLNVVKFIYLNCKMRFVLISKLLALNLSATNLVCSINCLSNKNYLENNFVLYLTFGSCSSKSVVQFYKIGAK